MKFNDLPNSRGGKRHFLVDSSRGCSFNYRYLPRVSLHLTKAEPFIQLHILFAIKWRINHHVFHLVDVHHQFHVNLSFLVSHEWNGVIALMLNAIPDWLQRSNVRPRISSFFSFLNWSDFGEGNKQNSSSETSSWSAFVRKGSREAKLAFDVKYSLIDGTRCKTSSFAISPLKSDTFLHRRKALGKYASANLFWAFYHCNEFDVAQSLILAGASDKHLTSADWKLRKIPNKLYWPKCSHRLQYAKMETIKTTPNSKQSRGARAKELAIHKQNVISFGRHRVSRVGRRLSKPQKKQAKSIPRQWSSFVAV